MGIRESTALSRELGNELKRRRKPAGLLCHELAGRLQWSASKVSRRRPRFLDVLHESTAHALHCFEPLVVPGLLQTEDYARARVSRASIGNDDIAYAVRARMRRQRILHDDWRPVRAPPSPCTSRCCACRSAASG
jgi:hypothetical protein